jgi:hypothetical protein
MKKLIKYGHNFRMVQGARVQSQKKTIANIRHVVAVIARNLLKPIWKLPAERSMFIELDETHFLWWSGSAQQG